MECTVVPVHGDTVTVSRLINPGCRFSFVFSSAQLFFFQRPKQFQVHLHCLFVLLSILEGKCPISSEGIFCSQSVSFKLSDPPSGAPVVTPSKDRKHAMEEVVLICHMNPAEDENPPCNQYFWSKVFNGRSEPVSKDTDADTKDHRFTMEEDKAGNYTCQCGNEFGVSGVSATSEVFFFTGPAPPPAPPPSESC